MAGVIAFRGLFRVVPIRPSLIQGCSFVFVLEINGFWSTLAINRIRLHRIDSRQQYFSDWWLAGVERGNRSVNGEFPLLDLS